MKILMTGGTGFLGTALRQRLEGRGDSLTCLSRARTGVVGSTAFATWNDLADLPPHDAVINLAGERVVGLWTRRKRAAIYRSRIETTTRLVDWIDRSPVKPSVFLSGSAVGIYGDGGDRELTEREDVTRVHGFLAKVCRDWEHAANPGAWKGVRTVLLRTGQVLDPNGGFLGTALPMMRRFPIVVLGPPDSYFPWVALEDWIGLALTALDDDRFQGPLNIVSPNPVTQRTFTTAIAKTLGKRVWGHVPAWALKLGAGGFGESMTYSERVVPEKAVQLRYGFKFETLEAYLAEASIRK